MLLSPRHLFSLLIFRILNGGRRVLIAGHRHDIITFFDRTQKLRYLCYAKLIWFLMNGTCRLNRTSSLPPTPPLLTK
jgi:hypothetical protein